MGCVVSTDLKEVLEIYPVDNGGKDVFYFEGFFIYRGYGMHEQRRLRA